MKKYADSFYGLNKKSNDGHNHLCLILYCVFLAKEQKLGNLFPAV